MRRSPPSTPASASAVLPSLEAGSSSSPASGSQAGRLPRTLAFDSPTPSEPRSLQQPSYQQRTSLIPPLEHLHFAPTSSDLPRSDGPPPEEEGMSKLTTISSLPSPLLRILCSRMFDSFSATFVANKIVTVDTASGLIVGVEDLTEESARVEGSGDILDLRPLVLLPGFVDAHVHLFLHSYAETPWTQQVLNESIVERTVRAVNHARRTLMAGFTTVRDLGTEGALDADVHLRASLSPPLSLSPAPRMFISTRAIVSTGSYGPRTQKWDDPGHEQAGRVVGAEVADGVDEIVKVVRRQIGRGADWIKIYADYPTRSASAALSPRLGSQGFRVFTYEEMEAAVRTATGLGVRVAAHATRASTIKDCIRAGVSTIEHGYDADRSTFELMKASSVIWVPTLAAYSQTIALLVSKLAVSRSTAQLLPSASAQARVGEEAKELRMAEDRWEKMKRAFALGREVGVMIACGGDTGVFPHGQNTLEMSRMLSLGASLTEVLSWCTYNGFLATASLASLTPASSAPSLSSPSSSYPCLPHASSPALEAGLGEVGGDAETHDHPFGRISPGFAADIVGVDRGSWEEGIGAEEFERLFGEKGVRWVMQGGREVKRGGREVRDGEE